MPDLLHAANQAAMLALVLPDTGQEVVLDDTSEIWTNNGPPSVPEWVLTGVAVAMPGTSATASAGTCDAVNIPQAGRTRGSPQLGLQMLGMAVNVTVRPKLAGTGTAATCGTMSVIGNASLGGKSVSTASRCGTLIVTADGSVSIKGLAMHTLNRVEIITPTVTLGDTRMPNDDNEAMALILAQL